MKHFFSINLFLLLLFYCVFVSAQNQILIVYDSDTGLTKQLSKSVANGAREVNGVNVFLKTTKEVVDQDLLNADAIIVGSPVHNANVSVEISSFISSWPFEGEPLKNKIGAAFVTGGGISAGEELVQMNILQSMLAFGMIVVGGPDWTQPFGASAVTNEGFYNAETDNQIDEIFLEKGRLLGKRVAELTLKLQDE